MNIGKINRISIANNAYVSGLKYIASPPLELYYCGEVPQKRRPTVAIIGSRKPTAYGKMVTHKFATTLAKRGVIIVSGLALGVDGIAHQAALDAGGTTIAVMANGLHRIYPASHTALGKQIIKQGGAVMSEKPLGYDARPYDFLARNRLISGIADAILVPEATERSGTLSTVRHALEQGRDVFAVPGPITSPLSAGTNSLLQQGSYPAVTPEDILRVIAPDLLSESVQTHLPLGDTPLETKIIALIKEGVDDGEALASRCAVTAAAFLETLTMLELKGVIYAQGANRWGLK